jgi:streptogramin lyase
VRIVGRRGLRLAVAISLTLVSCASEPTSPAPSETLSDRTKQVLTLPESGDIWDVAVSEDAVWVTSQKGLFRIDVATSEAVNVLPGEYLFRVAISSGSVWMTTGENGHVVRFDPDTKSVAAEIDVRAGPVTDLAVSEDAVWASASSELVRIDPATNEVVARLRSQGGFGDIALGESGLWVVSGSGEEGSVWRIDPATNDVRQRIPLANPSYWNEIAVGNGAVWVTSSPTVHTDGQALVHLHRIDPSSGDITAEIPLGDEPSELGTDEGAVSYSALALAEDSVLVLVSYEGLLLAVDRDQLSVSKTEDGVDCCSGLGPGMTVGAGSVWITVADAIMRISLEG